MSIILDDLNKEQKAAVINLDVPVRVLAGAGSGKTKVLTRKIAYLIKTKKLNPQKIIALTFTNKAANEMHQRVEELVGKELSDQMIISTFHSLCARFLRIEISNLKNYEKDFVILDAIDQLDVLKEIYRNHNISSNNISYYTMLEYISYYKNKQTKPIDIPSDDSTSDLDKLKINIYKEYQQILFNSKSLDFDDLLIFTKEILTNFPKVLKKWQEKFQYFLIDEFQDTSKIQYEIISMIAQNEKITIVGDPDQTIYSWRGADISFINDFDKLHPTTLTVTLSTNYRSTKNILTAANKLIANNSNRIPKNLITNNEEGTNIEFYQGISPETEALWVVSKINNLKKSKVQLKDIAILYRSNYYSRAIEDALISETIPHKIIGGQRFYERSEIKDSLSFLRSIWKPNDISLKRIINLPPRKIGETTIKKLISFAESKKLNLWDSWLKHFNEIKLPNETKVNLFNFINTLRKYNALLNKSHSISQILEELLNEIGYIKMLEEDENSTSSRFDNVKELLKSINTWEKKYPDKTIDDYLEEISLVSLNNEDDTNNINYVSLMTIHSAKGLEFKNVFVIGLNEDIFPSQKSLIQEDESDEGEKLEEERRLAYVAITRAKEKLFVSCTKGLFYDSKKLKKPSRFLKEMGIKVDNLSYKTPEMILESKLSKKNKEFHPGDIIIHTNFGEGIVLDINGDTIIIEFKNKDIGIKQLLKNHKSIERLIK